MEKQSQAEAEEEGTFAHLELSTAVTHLATAVSFRSSGRDMTESPLLNRKALEDRLPKHILMRMDLEGYNPSNAMVCRLIRHEDHRRGRVLAFLRRRTVLRAKERLKALALRESGA